MKKRALAFVICGCVFAALILTILIFQHQRLEQEFDALICNNLAAYTHSQKGQANATLRDINNTMEAVANMIEAADISPAGSWLDDFLVELGPQDGSYSIDYLSLDQLEAGIKSPSATEADREVLAQLIDGEEVISDIRYSHRLGGNYFAVAQPVCKNGATIGALRVRMSARLLTTTTQASQFYDNVNTCIINSQGEILYAISTDYQSTGDLGASLALNGLPEPAIGEIIANLEQGEDIAFQVAGKGKEYYVSLAKLGHNDWYIINFLRSTDVLYNYNSILRGVIYSAVVLILLTMVAGCVVIITIFRQNKRINLDNKRYAALAQFSDTLLFEYDYATDTLTFTPNAKEKLNLSSTTLKDISSSSHVLELLHPDYRALIGDIFQRFPPAETMAEVQYREGSLKVKDGSYRWFSCQYKYVAQGNAAKLIIGKLTDITDQRGKIESLEHQARQDTLTGTYNRSAEEIVNKMLHKSVQGVFFMVDLDNFKEINDTCGHIAGDSILSQVGHCLKGICGDSGVVARVGGDEFIVFLHGDTSVGAAKEKAAAILSGINRIKVGPPDGDMTVSASLGIALSPVDGVTYGELYAAADKAMYAVKQRSKGDFTLYDDEYPPSAEK